MATHKIKLQSSDGDTFEVDVEIAKQSATIKTMLEGQSFLVILSLRGNSFPLKISVWMKKMISFPYPMSIRLF